MNGPSKSVLAAEMRRVERAAASLSPLEREVLVLSAGQGMRNAEIAERLGLSGPRVERILARALRKFDRAMVPHRPGGAAGNRNSLSGEHIGGRWLPLVFLDRAQ